MFNPYEHMKARMKKDFDESIHFFNLMNTLTSMFEYKNLPDTLRSELIESLLITQGTAPVAMIKGELYTGTGGYCGETVNFIPERYQFCNVGVGEYNGKVGSDIVVGWNNATLTPDFSLLQISSILTEIDVSERVNVLFSRFLRVPKVKDNKEKKAVEDCIGAIMQGRFTAMVSDNIREILTDTDEKNNFLDLVDIKEVDKLQYLNQYRDNIVKRFFQMYGQGMQSTAKLAQQTTDELHGNDCVSLIIPKQRLYYRKKFCDDINKMFGTDITVDFSECWLEQEEEMEELYSNGEPEIRGDENAEKDTSKESTVESD